MKKVLSILMVLVMVIGLCTVASAEAGTKDKYIIGMAQCNLGEPWRVAMNDQIAAAAKDYPMFSRPTTGAAFAQALTGGDKPVDASRGY